MRYRAIVFDLDDTLHSERAYALSGFAAVAEAFARVLGPPSVSTARMRALFDSEARRRVFDTLLRERGHAPDVTLVARMVDCFRAHVPTISLHADARRALNRLAGAYRLGLISDGPAIMQRRKVEALGLDAWMDEIILTDELGPGHAKPDAAAFELMAGRLGVPGSACAYVADNPSKDFVAPNRLGWGAIRIVRPDGVYRDAPTAEGGAPGHVIRSLDRLDPVLA